MGFHSPFQLNFAVTYKCPLRCRNCFIWKRPGKGELSLDEIKKFAAGLKNIYWLRLTGGEPFLRPDFAGIAGAFCEALPGLYLVSAPTSGFDPERIEADTKKILSFMRSRFVVTVSLDGVEEVHDMLRGSAGSRSNAIDTYGRLKKLEAGHPNFKTLFGYTIQPENIFQFKKTLDEVKEIFPEISVNDFHVNLAQKSGVYYNNMEIDLPDEFFKNAGKELRAILEMRTLTTSPYSFIENIYLKLGTRYARTLECPIPCNVYNISAFVDPYGDVYPCTAFDRPLGNLRDYNFDLAEILSSARAKDAAKEIKERKCPQCWTPCEAHQMIVSQFLTCLIRTAFS